MNADRIGEITRWGAILITLWFILARLGEIYIALNKIISLLGR